jgi:hypothetical protein
VTAPYEYVTPHMSCLITHMKPASSFPGNSKGVVLVQCKHHEACGKIMPPTYGHRPQRQEDCGYCNQMMLDKPACCSLQ